MVWLLVLKCLVPGLSHASLDSLPCILGNMTPKKCDAYYLREENCVIYPQYRAMYVEFVLYVTGIGMLYHTVLKVMNKFVLNVTNMVSGLSPPLHKGPKQSLEANII